MDNSSKYKIIGFSFSKGFSAIIHVENKRDETKEVIRLISGINSMKNISLDYWILTFRTNKKTALMLEINFILAILCSHVSSF